MAAVATRLSGDDPIREEETDIVSATMNDRTRASSPPRRLQASSSFQGSKLSQANSLPPHLRGTASFASQGTPITIQRPTKDSSLGAGLLSNMKANHSARFGGFTPRNNLNRKGPAPPETQVGYTKEKRTHKQLPTSSEEEDELAGPGLDDDRNGPLPVKKRRTGMQQGSIGEYQRVESIPTAPNGLRPCLPKHVSQDIPDTRGETEKQKRDRKRQQTVLKHQEEHRSKVTSPYFAASAANPQKDQASLSTCRPDLSHDDLSTDNLDQHVIQSPVALKSRRSAGKTRAHRAPRRHEESWPIKSFHKMNHSYEQGSIELVVDKDTKMLGLRINDIPQSERLPLNMIYQVTFSSTLVRLFFRGPGPYLFYIWTLENAENLVSRLREFGDFESKFDQRTEAMFAKWRANHQNQTSSSVKGNLVGSPAMQQVSPQRKSPEQIDEVPKPTKRPKLHERLRGINASVNDDPRPITPVRSEIRTSPTSINAETPLQLGIKSYSPDNLTSKHKVSVITPSRMRPVRVGRTTRSSAGFDLSETSIPVEKYSKTHGFGPRWTEPLIWPQNAKKRVTVEYDDLERLDEEEYLNDSLVEFALLWLRLRQGNPANIYWFNTYFFEKINKGKPKDIDSDGLKRSRGRQIDYEGVKKWTKDVDLFSYDYVVVPINENHHWYLAIICNLPRLRSECESKNPLDTSQTHMEATDESGGVEASVNSDLATTGISSSPPKIPGNEAKPLVNDSADTTCGPKIDEYSPKARKSTRSRGRTRDPLTPTIITLDSFGAPHPQTIATLKLYLMEEARQRLGLTWEKDKIIGMTAKGIPYQENSTDCGLYLLGYVSAMLMNPSRFLHLLLLKELDFEEHCGSLNPSDLRRKLRGLIRKKHARQIQRARRAGHNKNTFEDQSGESSSDDVQFLGPEASTKKMNVQISTTTSPLRTRELDQKQPNEGSDVLSHVQNSTPLRRNTGRARVPESLGAIPGALLIDASVSKEEEEAHGRDVVPETPQASPKRKLHEAISTPEKASPVQSDHQSFRLSASPASSFGSTLRSYLGGT